MNNVKHFSHTVVGTHNKSKQFMSNPVDYKLKKATKYEYKRTRGYTRSLL